MSYLPIYQITPTMVNLVAEVVELAGSFDVNPALVPDPVVRKINQLRSVHSSTLIEGNTLSLKEVTAVIDGKRVIAPEREILEVRQAFQAYDAVSEMDPDSFDDLLRAHKTMMRGLTQGAGELRDVEVGIYKGLQLIHAGTPAEELSEAMDELFSWLQSSDDHPLIKGCFFHCAFEGIHPFVDGNGRTGRLWHSLINLRWRSSMAWVPVESMIAQNQQDYYHALRLSNEGDATSFIEFMLEMIRDALTDVIVRAESGLEDGVAVGVLPGQPNTKETDDGRRMAEEWPINDRSVLDGMLNDTQSKVFEYLRGEGVGSTASIAAALDIPQRTVRRALAALVEIGYVEAFGATRKRVYRTTMS